MIPKPLDRIEAADILALVANQEEERRSMDFKRDRAGDTDSDKRELRADVTSFANSAGGDLIFGVDEVGGVATAVPGLRGIDADKEILRIEGILQSGVDPRVPGVELRKVVMTSGVAVIIVRVPRSWRSPHLVKVNEAFRMFGRNSAGKYSFDATEIRSAYALSEEMPARIRRWRDDRLAKVIADSAPMPLLRGPHLVMHVVPLGAFAAGQEVPTGSIVKFGQHFPPLCEGGGDDRINIDGLFKYARKNDVAPEARSYCQVFRSGCVEGVTERAVDVHTGQRKIPSVWLAQKIVESVNAYRTGLLSCGVPLPLMVLTTLLDAKDSILAVAPKYQTMEHYTIDRDFLSFPEVLIESRDSDLFLDLRPLFDGLWNACGWAGCLDYDQAGKWNPTR